MVVIDQADFSARGSVLVAHSPAEALSLLEDKGFTEALVAGGGTLNGSFMREDLIDEVFVDVGPVAFGQGIRLFGDNDFAAQLELLETKELAPNEVQLHYTGGKKLR